MVPSTDDPQSVHLDYAYPTSSATSDEISEIDRRIKAQIQALENGIEPALVSARIGELRADKEALEEALAEVGATREEAEDEELAEQLARVPDLTKALAKAPPDIQRQAIEAFELQIAYDKAGGRVELTATVSEAVADAFENTKALRREGSVVVPRHSGGPIRLSLPPSDHRASCCLTRRMIHWGHGSAVDAGG